MISFYRFIVTLMILTGLTGCVSTEELYAQYDSQMCQPVLVSADEMPWHMAVIFPYNQSQLSSDEEIKLIDNLVLLNTFPQYRVILRGFADSVASQRYNLPLSKRRAQFVADWFIAQGVSGSRIDQTGLGKELLLIPPVDGQDEAVNRRVEMLLVDAEGNPVSFMVPEVSEPPETDKKSDITTDL